MQDLVLSSGSGSLGPSQSPLQLHHGHAHLGCGPFWWTAPAWPMTWFPSLTPDLLHHPWTCCTLVLLPDCPAPSMRAAGWALAGGAIPWGSQLPPLTLATHTSVQCHTSSPVWGATTKLFTQSVIHCRWWKVGVLFTSSSYAPLTCISCGAQAHPPAVTHPTLPACLLSSESLAHVVPHTGRKSNRSDSNTLDHAAPWSYKPITSLQRLSYKNL